MTVTSIGIVGAAGRMGRRLVSLAHNDPELQLVAALEAENHPQLGQDVGELAGIGKIGVAVQSDLPRDVVVQALVDFSIPEGTSKVLKVCTERRIPLVLATTGHTTEQKKEIESAAHETALLTSPNMSLSVNVLFELVRQSARMLTDKDFDVEIVERHHRYKVDSPSGTALRFAEIVQEVMGEMELRHGREGIGGERPRTEIGMHAIRVGDNVGEHAILFSALGETVELIHRAHSRDSYARGALQGAKFLADQPPGSYSMRDVLGLL